MGTQGYIPEGKEEVSVRLYGISLDQLRDLMRYWGDSRSGALMRCIDREWHSEFDPDRVGLSSPYPRATPTMKPTATAEVGKQYRNIHTNEIYTVKEIYITSDLTIIVTDKGDWASPLFQDHFRDDVQNAAAVPAAGVVRGKP